MKQLQNNFTTPEQSKRLLKLGLPVDSADCVWWSNDNFTSGLYDLSIIPYNKMFSNDRRLDEDGQVACLQKLPCWSVGRLIEIYVIARGVDTAYFPVERDENMIKYLIRLYKEKVTDLDFSKLEE